MDSTTGIWLLLGFFILQSLRSILTQRGAIWKIVVNIVANILITIGAFGFFGSALASSGALKELIPNSFEWAVGTVDNAIKMDDGTIIVPHEPSGRIQIYDKHLSFQQGWFVNAGGGMFSVKLDSKNRLYVHTTRGDHKYLYDINGTLLSEGEEVEGSGKIVSVTVPTPWYMMFLVHPFIAWIMIALGMLLLFLVGKSETTNKKGKK